MNVSIKINSDRVAQSIKQYAEQLNVRMTRTLERLAEIGISSASAAFRTARYDGENDVVVSSLPEWLDDHRLAVTASGASILFIEFGTGVFNPGTHPRANELGMIRGAYGKGQGRKESWTYVGEPGTDGYVVDSARNIVRTRGNDANRSMYDAAEEMRKNIQRIAEEVWRGG